METVHDTDAVIEAVEESGLRAVIGKCMMDSNREAPQRLQEQTRVSIDDASIVASIFAEAGSLPFVAIVPEVFLLRSRQAQLVRYLLRPPPLPG